MLKKDELKNIVFISIALASIIAISYLFILKSKLELANIGRAVSFGITITTFFWTFYFTTGWKWKISNWIFYRPNINGTWSGVIVSDYIDPTGNKVLPIEFYIVIRQSFIRIHFTTFTKDFVGVSYAETFALNKDKGLKNVAYLYKKDSTQTNDEHLREGATELRLIIGKDEKKLEGKYWSNTKTQGIVSVSQISEEHVDCFTNAQKLKNV
ncbi:MAG: hypothetical protein V4497_03485 [Bacteroidota bacterium]